MFLYLSQRCKEENLWMVGIEIFRILMKNLSVTKCIEKLNKLAKVLY